MACVCLVVVVVVVVCRGVCRGVCGCECGCLGDRGGAGALAVGEAVIVVPPPSPFSRRFNMDGEGMSAK